MTNELWEVEYTLDLRDDGTFLYIRDGRGHAAGFGCQVSGTWSESAAGVELVVQESSTTDDYPAGSRTLLRRRSSALELEDTILDLATD